MSKSTGVATLKWLEYKYLKILGPGVLKWNCFPSTNIQKRQKVQIWIFFHDISGPTLGHFCAGKFTPPTNVLPNWGKSAVLPWSQIQKIEFINEKMSKNGAVFAFFGPFLGGNYIGKVPRLVSRFSMSEKKTKQRLGSTCRGQPLAVGAPKVICEVSSLQCPDVTFLNLMIWKAFE